MLHYCNDPTYDSSEFLWTMCMQVQRLGCGVPVPSSCSKTNSRCEGGSCRRPGSCCGPCGPCGQRSSGCATCCTSCCGTFPETCCGPWCESCLDPAWFTWLAPNIHRACCCACMPCCRPRCR
ncbi:keratin-associated protein 5-5 [Drosophila biarmipes]|uniref:keratin-associated protein 5-5 n=1 Tax=Drosophila biarmipes TaxID=125945 RepID=UPI0007E6E2C0|nr:keratin-associated protein 5-5 [Drosophila biarmipes]